MRPPVVETPDVKVPATPAGPRFFKAVTLGGFDFRTGTVWWLPADGTPIPEGGWLVEHSHPGDVGAGSANGYLSAATVPTDCNGFLWPARLLLVEPVGSMWTPDPDRAPHKRAANAWRAVRELPAWRLFGPQGREVASLIEQAAHLTSPQIEDLVTVRAAAWDAAWDAALGAVRVATRVAALGAARVAAWDAALGAVRVATRDVAWGAALGATYGSAYAATQDSALGAARGALGAVLGWLVKDLISVEDFRILAGPWEQVVGRVIA